MAIEADSGRVDEFPGGGEMGRLIRARDWSATPLGPIEGWPGSLKTAVQLLLNSRYPLFIWWGSEFINIYNDAYLPTLGPRHPAGLGRSAADLWSEAWDVLGPQASAVLHGGPSTWNEELLLFLERNGYPEETYHTFSYSRVVNDRGGLGGVFCAVTEETQRVLGRRRLATLREVAARTNGAADAEAACRSAAEASAGNPRDLPFALIYLIEPETGVIRLAGASGLTEGSPARPERVEPTDPGGPASWPFAEVGATGTASVVDDLAGRFGPMPGGDWDDPTRSAVVLPILQPGQARPAGFLVAGLSPRRPFDDDYRGFLDLLAGQIATAVANARAYAEERRRAEALAVLDRAKTAFFSNVSHEFRTPLTLMLGPIEDLLAEADALAPGARATLGAVHRNALRLQKLVNTLLDFSRIEAGRVRAAFEPTDLAALTADLASTFRSACERAGLELRVDCPPMPGPVGVDRDMWEKIVLNLLSNAFKYTLEGRITVGLRADGDRVELEVRDTGTGIPPEEVPRLFERFHRVEGAGGRTQEGSGIGLALVRELARLHGGDARAESEPGVGSAFLVTIPMADAARPIADPAAAPRPGASTALGASAFVEEALRWLPDSPSAIESGGDAPPDPDDPTAPRPHVLLADDNADMRDYVRRLLADRFEVTAVADGLSALASARARPPDLVLSDVMMPGLDGFGLIRELRADPATRDLPVLLLSARAGEEARIEGLEAGADDYLTKPFHARELLARVGSQIDLSRLRRRAEQERRRGDEIARSILESVTDAFFGLDHAWKFVYVNRQAERLLGRRPGDLLGKDLWEEYPGLHGSPFEPVYHRAVEDRVPGSLTAYYPDHDRWYEVHAYPAADGISVYFRDATDRVRSEQERDRLVRDLREADRGKDEFLATLAHELRNPLAPIRNALQIIRLSVGDPSAVEESRAMMERHVSHMVRLVDDLLDISRISRDKLELRRERADLAAIIRQAVETSLPMIEASGHELAVTQPARPIVVDADVTRLAQVFSNLLNNAAKYTEPGGKIALTVGRRAEEVVVSVRDDGVGIPAQMLPRVFEMFTQVDRSLERSQGGLGIGLTLVRRLVEMHGGTVEARSDGPGLGSEFIVRLPLLVASPPSPPAQPPSDDGRDGAAVARRILVVDDNRDAARSLARLLKIVGNEVRTAHDGIEAVEAAEAFRPEVILLDIGMPGKNGYDAAIEIRSRPWGVGPTLIALTGWGQEDDRRRSKEAGFDHHLVKPVDPDALMALLNGFAAVAARE